METSKFDIADYLDSEMIAEYLILFQQKNRI